MTQESPHIQDHPPGLHTPASLPTPIYTSLALYTDHFRSPLHRSYIMANIKHVISATSSALVTTVGTVSNLFEWAAVHSNEAVERSRIETLESRKPWATTLMLDTQKAVQTAASELQTLGYTPEEINEETFRIIQLFNKK